MGTEKADFIWTSLIIKSFSFTCLRVFKSKLSWSNSQHMAPIVTVNLPVFCPDNPLWPSAPISRQDLNPLSLSFKIVQNVVCTYRIRICNGYKSSFKEVTSIHAFQQRHIFLIAFVQHISSLSFLSHSHMNEEQMKKNNNNPVQKGSI